MAEERSRRSRPADLSIKAAALATPDNVTRPQVVIAGSGPVGRAIVDAAKDFEIPVVHESRLANELAPSLAGSPVPQESLHLVAEILSFLYEADAAWRNSHPQFAPASLPTAPKLPR